MYRFMLENYAKYSDWNRKQRGGRILRRGQSSRMNNEVTKLDRKVKENYLDES